MWRPLRRVRRGEGGRRAERGSERREHLYDGVVSSRRGSSREGPSRKGEQGGARRQRESAGRGVARRGGNPARRGGPAAGRRWDEARQAESRAGRRGSVGREGGTGVKRRAEPGSVASVGSGGLPRWVSEELARVTPRARVREAVNSLEQAAVAFVAGRYGKARRDAEEAKELSPRLPAAREVLGLAAYRLGQWDQALAELRTYRRLSGDTTHLPVEMDALRALGRDGDVEAAYALLRRLGGSRATLDEGRVVYASFLLDQDRAREAWDLTRPVSLDADPSEGELRVWYVAGRAAARLGERTKAQRLYEAIQEADPGFPGLDELAAALES